MNRALDLREYAIASEERAVTIAPACAGDSRDIAALIDLAGEGIPRAIWQHYAPALQEPLAFGAERAASGSGNFSWRNARLAKQDSIVLGMVLAYRLPDTASDLSDAHPLEVPLVALESQAPGTFYINAVAVYTDEQSQGVGQRLIEEAHRMARAAGCERSSLIVFAHNLRARALYRRLGYVEQARQPAIDHPDFRILGECVLMTRDV